MEQKRGISITSTVLQFPYRDHVVNLLDTPGHRDFSEDTYRVLAAADAAVMVLDGARGIEPQTRKLFEVCRDRGVPLLTFVNKWDRPSRPPLELLDEIESQLRHHPDPGHLAGRVGRGLRRPRRPPGRPVHPVHPGGPRRRGGRRGAAGARRGRRPRRRRRGRPRGARPARRRRPRPRRRGVPGSASPRRCSSARPSPTSACACCSTAWSTWRRRPRPGTGVDGEPRQLDDPFSAFVFKVQANMDPSHRDRIAFVRRLLGPVRAGHGGHPRPDRASPSPPSTPTRCSARSARRSRRPSPATSSAWSTPPASAWATRSTPAPPVEFPGIPSFAPELFASIRARDAGKFKQFRSGIAQLDEEGVVQVLRDPDLGDQAPMLAAVGPDAVRGGGAPARERVRRAGRAEHRRATRWPGSPTRPRRRRCGPCRACGCSSGPTAAILALFESPYWLARVEADQPELRLDRLVAEGLAG